MDIARKAVYAKLNINNIATHDDAPIEDVAAALAEIKGYADEVLAQAQERRALAAAVADTAQAE